MTLLALGANHDTAPVALRERLAIGPDALPGTLRELRRLVPEVVILSTCNRVEVYAECADAAAAAATDALRRRLAELRDVPAALLEEHLYAYAGRDAARQLFRVACGLDSLLLGEPQILTQARRALEDARAAGASGPLLTRGVQDALRVGKRARTRTGIARNRLSIPHAAVDLAARQLDGLAGRAALVLGAGEMATLAAKLLRRAGVGELLIANRTPERAAALAAQVGGRAIPPAEAAALLARVDIVVAALTTTRPALGGAAALAACAARTTQLVALDLGVPRNIALALGALPAVRLFAVDDLRAVADERRAGYAREMARAEALVEEAVAGYEAWRAERATVPTVVALRERAEAIRAAELERALRKLSGLSARDREVVKALSVAITNTLLHEPTLRIKADGPQGVAERGARRLFGLEPGATPDDAPAETLAYEFEFDTREETVWGD